MKNGMLRNYLLVFFGILLFMGMGAPGETVVVSKWTDEPVDIDGSLDEWVDDEFAFEKNFDVDYAFRNDAEHLYVLFVFNNPEYLSTIPATGMTIWFDTQGKKKKDFGIRFVKKQVTADELIQVLEKQGEVLTEQQKTEIRLKPNYLLYDGEVLGRRSKQAAAALARGEAKPPTFRSVRKGKTTVIYEFRIPLSATEHPAGIGTEPGKTIRVGFEWGGMTPEMREVLMARRAASAAGRAETRGSSMTEAVEGGTERLEGTGGVPEDLEGRPKKYSFWTDVKLAQGE